MEPSQDQKEENYLRLVTTSKYIEEGGRITEDWMEEHKKLILQYREIFPNIALVNQEMMDSSFRKLCNDTETLLAYLVNTIKTDKTFNVKLYKSLNDHIIKICSTIMDMNDITSLMNMLAM